MGLPSRPPYYGSPGSNAAWLAMLAPIRHGEHGWRVFAVQHVVKADPDGLWGDQTDQYVRDWQKANGLAVDGIVGGVTQAKMLRVLARRVDARFTVMPDGLLDGFARVEGANILAATNPYTPPGGRVGTDCGPCQIRVYAYTDGSYPMNSDNSNYGLKTVFNPELAFTVAARMFTGRITNYRARNQQLTKQQIVEAAVLAHNWPAGADQIIRYGHVLEPDKLAGWTVIPVAERPKYGGRTQYTRGEWAKEYPSRVLKGVDY